MTPSPSNPHEQHNGANLPERISGASGTSGNNEQRRVLDAEVLEPGQEHDRRNSRTGAFGDQDRHSGRGFGGAEFRRGFGPGGPALRPYLDQRTHGARTPASRPASRLPFFWSVWPSSACWRASALCFFTLWAAWRAACATCALLMQGREPNPWPWRIGNWLVCFLLTAWACRRL